MNDGAEILLTGATGFLGKVVLHELIRRADELDVERVYLVVRRTRHAPEDRARTEIVASPCFAGIPEGWEKRIEVIEGDLSAPGAGIDPNARAALTRRLTHVIHCAASVQFDLPLAEAAAANVTSALNVLDLAQDCPHLASMVNVSTAYVTPHNGGESVVEERLAPLPLPAREIYDSILEGSADEAALLAETGHPNTYTLTKCLAEHLLAQRHGQVPLALIRPSIISASLRRPSPGWIDSPAAFALVIMAIASGRMRAIVADPHARVDIVPCDDVARPIIDAAFAMRPRAGDAPVIRHAVAGFERSPTLALCRREIVGFFQRNPLDGVGGRDSVARVRYLGPDGARYRIRHWLHHCRRPDARIVAGRLDEMNRVFSYFTQSTFRFVSSVPLDDPDFEPRAYVATACRGVAGNLMGGDESAVSFAGRRHTSARSDLYWALSRPRGNAFVRLAAWAATKVLRRCTERISFDWCSFETALAEAPAGAPLVIVPSHRSYMDFVLVSYLAFARPDLGIGIPHVAAASEFSRVPVLGWLFRGLHAFYVRTGLGRDEKKLNAKVNKLIRKGRTIELFIESHRSRDRRFLAPRWEMLRSLQATGETIALLPVAISYERVPEEASFIEELGGAEPSRGGLRGLLGWALRVARGEVDLGRIHLSWGRLVTLDTRADLNEVCRALFEQLQAQVVITTRALRAFLDAERVILAGVELQWLRRAIERRGGRVLDSSRLDEPLPASVERCMRHQFEHLFYADAAAAFVGNPAVEHLIRCNGYMEFRSGPAASDTGDPRLQRVLEALFAPTCRDFAAAANALGSPAASPGVRSPRALLAVRCETHLPHADAAFADLVGRGILVSEGDQFGWGPRAAEIDAYRATCTRGFATDVVAKDAV
jgi:thioester reductase-like protein